MRQELLYVGAHKADIGLVAQKVRDGLVQPRQIAQRRLVVGVGQHPHVEDIVCIHRDAAFEGEGLKYQGQLPLRSRHQALDVALQLRRPYRAGVDDMRLLTQVRQQFSLQFDDLHQGPSSLLKVVMGERVAAARLGESPYQGVDGGIQKDRLHGHALAAQAIQLLGDLVQRGRAAHVHGDGDSVPVVAMLQRNEGGQQLGWEVVYAVIPGVFQGMQGHGLPGARHPCDQDNFKCHQSLSARVVATWFSISRAWAKVVSVERSPPSMRAISATRCSS